MDSTNSQGANNYVIRPATKDDMQAVRDMIQDLANFEKMPDGPRLTTKELIEDCGLNGGKDFFHCYIAETTNKSPLPDRPLTGNVVGYAICFFTYSTWNGKSYFMEDIYVKPEHRTHGVGKHLLTEVIRRARGYNYCSRLDFHVLDWNPARKFYEHMGAVNLTESEGWHFYRIHKEQMDKILENQK